MKDKTFTVQHDGTDGHDMSSENKNNAQTTFYRLIFIGTDSLCELQGILL